MFLCITRLYDQINVPVYTTVFKIYWFHAHSPSKTDKHFCIVEIETSKMETVSIIVTRKTMNMRKLSRPKLQISKHNNHLEIWRQKVSWNIQKNCFINVHQFMADDTPTKSVPFLSPSSDVICIICYEDLQKKYGNNAGKGGYKINLWRQHSKTEACTVVEQFLQCSLDYSKNLKCICRSCLNQLKKGQKILSAGQLQLKGNQEKAEETFLRVRVKRELSSSTEATSKARRSLNQDIYTRSEKSESTKATDKKVNWILKYINMYGYCWSPFSVDNWAISMCVRTKHS